jgi:hypothetical protein
MPGVSARGAGESALRERREPEDEQNAHGTIGDRAMSGRVTAVPWLPRHSPAGAEVCGFPTVRGTAT